jgi:histidinol-phosphatase (PHP family)
MKKDGHTHTQYCLHGSGEKTEDFIKRAIGLEFDQYTLTEHLIISEELVTQSAYADGISHGSHRAGQMDLDQYIRDMHELKKKYQKEIQVLVGFEVDYNPHNINFVKSIMKEYGKYLDEAVVSVHYIQGKNGWRCPAFSPQDFNEGLLQYYGTYEKVQLEYLQLVKEAVMSDLGIPVPIRIGHMTFCNKYRKTFDDGTLDSTLVQTKMADLLELIKGRNLEIDVNTAGLFNDCKETYPPSWVLRLCRAMSIRLVYGSDAHAVDQVGRGYEIFYKEAMG